jgi:hypothetical protein
MDSSFKITGINLFSSWVYNLPKNSECTICRCNLNLPSLYNQDKGLDSYVVSGICNHSFHNECIKPWVEKNKYCPICFQKWEFAKKEDLKNFGKQEKEDIKKNEITYILKGYNQTKEVIKKDWAIIADIDNEQIFNDKVKEQNFNIIKDSFYKFSKLGKLGDESNSDYDDMPGLVNEQTEKIIKNDYLTKDDVKKKYDTIFKNELKKVVMEIDDKINEKKINIIKKTEELFNKIETDNEKLISGFIESKDDLYLKPGNKMEKKY